MNWQAIRYILPRRSPGRAEEIGTLLQGKTTTVAGPSGVGKSSLINGLQDHTLMETGAISQKIGRGKHTTRHSELIPIGWDSFIMDTPGFSSMYVPEIEAGGYGNVSRNSCHMNRNVVFRAAPI